MKKLERVIITGSLFAQNWNCDEITKTGETVSLCLSAVKAPLREYFQRLSVGTRLELKTHHKTTDEILEMLSAIGSGLRVTLHYDSLTDWEPILERTPDLRFDSMILGFTRTTKFPPERMFHLIERKMYVSCYKLEELVRVLGLLGDGEDSIRILVLEIASEILMTCPTRVISEQLEFYLPRIRLQKFTIWLDANPQLGGFIDALKRIHFSHAHLGTTIFLGGPHRHKQTVSDGKLFIEGRDIASLRGENFRVKQTAMLLWIPVGPFAKLSGELRRYLIFRFLY